MTKIYAPQSGTADMVMLKAGQAISPGIPLCNILNLSDLKIKGEVTEAYAAKVKRGDKVQVFFPDLNKEISRWSLMSARASIPIRALLRWNAAFRQGASTAPIRWQ